MPTLSPGAHTAAIPITVVPTGQSCGADIVLSSDAAGANIVATSSVIAFTSTGAVQTVNVPVTIPSTQTTLYSWVGVYVNGILVGVFPQATTITVPSVTVGVISWS